MERVYEFLKRAGVFYMATECGEEPKVRPFGFVMVYKDRLYFCTNNQKEVYRQIKENSNVEICACIGTEWIRVRGKALFDHDMEAKRQVFTADPGMCKLYQAEDEIFEIFYLCKGEAVFADMNGRIETVYFS